MQMHVHVHVHVCCTRHTRTGLQPRYWSAPPHPTAFARQG